jgi:uncharacterized protein YjbI with pentapeptide repeats
MTVRDWLPIVGALLIPVVIAAGGWWIMWQQGKIAEQRAETDRELAEQRAQGEAQQAFLDQMSTLLLEKGLRNSEDDSEVRTLARARTATVIQRLDAHRNRHVIRFLNEARLIGKGQSSIRLLAGADLQGAALKGIDLSTTDLSEADLGGADLIGVDLRDADLQDAYLRDADLGGADLSEADLSRADLSGANLGADLSGETNLSDANLQDANLSGTDLGGADLEGANLSHACLRDAYLDGVDLSGAYKVNNEGSKRPITNEELEQQASSLKGATMPDGQKYEDWLKSKGRGEDGENSGPS